MYYTKKLLFIRENTGMADFYLSHICDRDAKPLTIKPYACCPFQAWAYGFSAKAGFSVKAVSVRALKNSVSNPLSAAERGFVLL